MTRLFTVLCVLLVLTIPLKASAVENHVEQGKYLVGAGTALSYDYDREEQSYDKDKIYYKSDGASFEAMFGYFIFNGLEIGPKGFVGIENDRETKYDGDYTETSSMPEGGFGGQVGFWVFTNSNFYPFVTLELLYHYSSGYEKGEYKHDSDGEDWKTETEYTGYSGGPTGGFSYFVTREAAINIGLKYEITELTGTRKYKQGGDKQTNDVTATTTRISFVGGIGLFF